MRRNTIGFILLSMMFSIFSASAQTISNHPITISLKKEMDGKYNLLLELPPNYGFQREAPHKILLSGTNGVKVKKADLKLNGPIHPSKSEYYEFVKPMPIELSGKGKLDVNAKIYYCNFVKNICIPAKLNETLDIP
ncbi:MAG: hypothetical protein SH817_06590 [Leptospira sp.]|nr:hypothetical protein [Leptospira sp.]